MKRIEWRQIFARIVKPRWMLIGTITAVVLFALSSRAFGQVGAPAQPAQFESFLNESFSYQGQLKQGGGPVTGACDFQFGLYDALTLGARYGVTQTLTAQTVTNGLFDVVLNSNGQFGTGPFNGSERYLAVAVRCPAGSGSYTALTPRQRVSPAPYALFSIRSLTTSALQGWMVSNSSPASGQVLKYNGAQWAPGADLNGAYQGVVTVAKSGGDFTTISAALSSITTASAANRYLVRVMPGVYAEQVLMKPFVDIEGSGELNTTITAPGTNANTGTVVGADNAEIRFLTMECTGGNANSFAFFSSGVSPRLTHVTAVATGSSGYNIGLYFNFGAPTVNDATASASGGNNNYGVFTRNTSAVLNNVTASGSGGIFSEGVHNTDAGKPVLNNVTARASGGSNTNSGVNNDNAAPVMTNMTIFASGGANTYGVHNVTGAALMTNLTISVTLATGINAGVANELSSGEMNNVKISASGGTSAYGVLNLNNSSPVMTGVSAYAAGGTSNYGVRNESSSAPQMTEVIASASGGNNSYGVSNVTSSPEMTRVSAYASSAYKNFAVHNISGAAPVLTNVTAIASGSWNGSTGFDAFAAYTDSASMTAEGSTFRAIQSLHTYGVYMIRNDINYTVLVTISNSRMGGNDPLDVLANTTARIGSSWLESSNPAFTPGTVTCVGDYNQNFVALDATCK